MVLAETMAVTSGMARRELRFGAWATGTDGPLGRLRQVLLEPETLRVTGVVLRAGWFPPRELRMPLGKVVRAMEDDLRLDLTVRKATELRHEQARRAEAPGEAPATESGLPAAVAVREGHRVTTWDGLAGRLRALLVDGGTGRVEEFLVESAGQCRRMPAAWVRCLTGRALVVDATRAAVGRLPLFRSDREVRGEILDAWYYDDFLRPLHLGGSVNVHVRDGVAEVEGYAWSRLHRRRLESVARRVPGVRGVVMAVATDDELALQVEAALRGDPRTRTLRPRVRSSLGTITLHGEAPDRATRAAASAVADCHPLVQRVVNRLRVVRARRPAVPLQGDRGARWLSGGPRAYPELAGAATARGGMDFESGQELKQ